MLIYYRKIKAKRKNTYGQFILEQYCLKKILWELLFYKVVMASSALVFISYTSSYDQSEIEGHESTE